MARSDIDRKSRQILGGIGMLVLMASVLFAAGAIVMVPRIEHGLAADVRAALRPTGYDVGVSFSGQDATISCTTSLADIDRVVAMVRAVDGVHAVGVAPSCRPSPDDVVPGSSLPADTTTAPTAAVASTVSDTSAPSTTVVSSSTEPAPSTVPDTGELLSIVYADGGITIGGALATDTQQRVLESISALATSSGNVDDATILDPTLTVPDRLVANFATIILSFGTDAVSGRITVQHDHSKITAVSIDAVVPDAKSRRAVAQVVKSRGLSAVVTLRTKATKADAAAVAADMSAATNERPVQFDEQGGTVKVAAASMALMRRLAGMARRFDGLVVEVQGYTESAGSAGTNRVISQRRAAAVRAALVSLGVTARRVTAVGYGGTSPVLDASGVEDVAKSRRITFAVKIG